MELPASVTPQQLLDAGLAPVKLRYLRALRPEPEVQLQQATAVDAPAQQGVGDAKSKRQQKRERSKARFSATASLCTSFAAGHCPYGDSCKFNHDLVAYLPSKPADLPGSCPFSCLEACPYGVACRWADSHTDPTGAMIAAARAKLLVQGNGHAQSGTADAVAAPADTSAAAAEAAAAAAAATTTGGVAERAPHIQPLPVPSSVLKETNALSKQMQQDLWKDGVDFGRANAVLRSLGYSTGSGRAQQPQGRKQQQQASSKKARPGAAEPASKRLKQDPGQQQQTSGQPAEQGPTAMHADGAQPQASGPSSTPAAQPEPASANAATAAPSLLDSLYDMHSEESPSHTATSAAVASTANGAATAALTAQLPVHSAAPSCGADAAPSLLHGLYEPEQAPVAAAVTSGSVASTGPQTAAAAAAAATAAAATGCSGPDSAAAAHVEVPLHAREKRPLDVAGKLYLAPLTTVGNLPFRRLCKRLGADITCGEMALGTNLLKGQASEWALLKRHPSEDMFGVQVCGGFPDTMCRLAQLIEEHIDCSFVDVNMGCPIDIICNRAAGSAMMQRPKRIEEVVRSMSSVLSVPLTVKLRKAYYDHTPLAHTIVPQLADWGAAAVTLHGRTREQRYSRLADWDYIQQCAAVAAPLPLIGNGDVFGYEDWQARMDSGAVSTCMIARGALIKPWIFTEIKEQRVWDISASERFDQLAEFSALGLEHWGSDSRGVENTRRFLLEWLSFTWRYIPVGLLDVLPQQMHWRPPAIIGRNDLETLLASDKAADWVAISERLLGPAPPGFSFTPKHKSYAYASSAPDLAKMLSNGAAGTGAAAQERLVADEGEDVENG